MFLLSEYRSSFPPHHSCSTAGGQWLVNRKEEISYDSCGLNADHLSPNYIFHIPVVMGVHVTSMFFFVVVFFQQNRERLINTPLRVFIRLSLCVFFGDLNIWLWTVRTCKQSNCMCADIRYTKTTCTPLYKGYYSVGGGMNEHCVCSKFSH